MFIFEIDVEIFGILMHCI